MAEPFVFHFSPGPSGRPRVLYIVDLDCACGLCGHPQLQRFYHAAPFHPFTLGRFLDLIATAPFKADGECEQCGSAVHADHVLRWAVRYGFTDDAGEVVGYASLDSGSEPVFQVWPRRRLDPQVQPRHTPDEGAAILDTFDDEICVREFGRTFHVKTLWRELFEDYFEDPSGGAWVQAAPRYWLCVDRTEEGLDAILDDLLDAQDDAHELVVVSMHDAVPNDLPTHDDPLRMPGHLGLWWPDRAVHALASGELHAAVVVDESEAVDVLTRTFETARLTWQRTEDEEGSPVFTHITTPREGRYRAPLSAESLARRAAYTGITPGEAGRLTAEEIVGLLLGVWNGG
ncbi:MAG: hypothetical protein AAGI01_02070 [Myxococcota bacterium]